MLAYALAATVAVLAQSGGRTVDVRVGPLVLVAVQRVGTATATTFGSGLLAAAVLGGIVNALAAALLARRLRRIRLMS
jgi:hypothetical protein